MQHRNCLRAFCQRHCHPWAEGASQTAVEGKLPHRLSCSRSSCSRLSSWTERGSSCYRSPSIRRIARYLDYTDCSNRKLHPHRSSSCRRTVQTHKFQTQMIPRKIHPHSSLIGIDRNNCTVPPYTSACSSQSRRPCRQTEYHVEPTRQFVAEFLKHQATRQLDTSCSHHYSRSMKTQVSLERSLCILSVQRSRCLCCCSSSHRDTPYRACSDR